MKVFIYKIYNSDNSVFIYEVMDENNNLLDKFNYLDEAISYCDDRGFDYEEINND